jgi:hypothetical protein
MKVVLPHDLAERLDFELNIGITPKKVLENRWLLLIPKKLKTKQELYQIRFNLT